MTLVPCTVQPIWHTPEACDTPFICESGHRPGTVQRIDPPIRDAVELAGRSREPHLMRAAAWMVEARAEVVQP